MNNIKVDVLRLFTVRSLSNRIFKKALQSDNHKLMQFTREEEVLDELDIKVKIMSL